jgi:hypothetical protein
VSGAAPPPVSQQARGERLRVAKLNVVEAFGYLFQPESGGGIQRRKGLRPSPVLCAPMKGPLACRPA